MANEEKNAVPHISPFDSIRHESEQYGEYWSGRELYKLLGYSRWEKFRENIERAINICLLVQPNASEHFHLNCRTVQLGSGANRCIEDYNLTRYALFLVLTCSNLCKSETIKYFAYISTGLITETNKFQIALPHTIRVTKEQITINQIIKAFKHLRSIRQFSARPYFIDLYFPDYKIAVECDEDNHRFYPAHLELERQNHIEEMLHCTFVRYNPDDKDFNVGDVIHRIMMLVNNDGGELIYE